MKFSTLILFVGLTVSLAYSSHAQSCSEILQWVKSEGGYGSSYSSYTSDAIRNVTFYSVQGDNYKTYYFAVVQFTSSYQEYIYQVGSNTKFNYSLHYLTSAGKAFWEYIQPYSDQLGCAPSF